MSKPGKYNWGENEKVFEKRPENEEMGEMRLFPEFLSGSTASATESTSLIQVGMPDEDTWQAYDSVYSYRCTDPEKEYR